MDDIIIRFQQKSFFSIPWYFAIFSDHFQNLSSLIDSLHPTINCNSVSACKSSFNWVSFLPHFRTALPTPENNLLWSFLFDIRQSVTSEEYSEIITFSRFFLQIVIPITNDTFCVSVVEVAFTFDTFTFVMYIALKFSNFPEEMYATLKKLLSWPLQIQQNFPNLTYLTCRTRISTREKNCSTLHVRCKSQILRKVSFQIPWYFVVLSDHFTDSSKTNESLHPMFDCNSVNACKSSVHKSVFWPHFQSPLPTPKIDLLWSNKTEY